MSDQDQEYPKMVYPNGPDVKNTAVGTGVIVHSQEEEDEAMKDAPVHEHKEPAPPAAGQPGWTSKTPAK